MRAEDLLSEKMGSISASLGENELSRTQSTNRGVYSFLIDGRCADK